MKKENAMYKKILVPLDGSELSESSLIHMKAISQGLRVPEVVLLRVVEPFHYIRVDNDTIQSTQDKLKEHAKRYLDGVAEKIKREGIHAGTVVLDGDVSRNILDYIKVNDVDLVIMTTHGLSGMARWTLGSVAEKIVRHSKAPVLIVVPTGWRDD
jgi:nucleotide-binding universal stress UspA family protein